MVSYNKSIILFSGMLMMLSAVRESAADSVFLKNGREITGTIVEETDDKIKIDCLDMGMFVSYKKANVVNIERDGKNLPQSAAVVEQNENNDKNDFNPTGAATARTIEENGYIVYLPSGLSQGQHYPLVVMFHPVGAAQAMIDLWRDISEQKKWMLYASKNFRNGMENWGQAEEEMLNEVFRNYPVDKKRVVTTGISGGGMGAHMWAFFHSEAVAAVITNVGCINPYFTTEKARKDYPRDKLAVFLASPTDRNFEGMQSDREFLDGLGWETEWIEFEGGHGSAPAEAYEQAADWLERNW